MRKQPQLHLPPDQPGFLPKLVPGTATGRGAPPGFPTLTTLELQAELKKAGVNPLGASSKRDSLVLVIKV